MWSKAQHINIPSSEIYHLQEVADFIWAQGPMKTLRSTFEQRDPEFQLGEDQPRTEEEIQPLDDNVLGDNQETSCIGGGVQSGGSSYSMADIEMPCHPAVYKNKYTAHRRSKRNSFREKLMQVLDAPQNSAQSETSKRGDSDASKQSNSMLLNDFYTLSGESACATYAVNQLKNEIKKQKEINQKNKQKNPISEKLKKFQNFQYDQKQISVKVEEICHKDECEGGMKGAKIETDAVHRNNQYFLFKKQNQNAKQTVKYPQFENQIDVLEDTKKLNLQGDCFQSGREWFEVFAALGQSKIISSFSDSKLSFIQIDRLMSQLKPSRWNFYGVKNFPSQSVLVQYEDDDDETAEKLENGVEEQDEEALITEDRIVPVNTFRFSDWKELFTGQIVEVYTSESWWCAKITEKQKKSIKVQYVYYPDIDQDKFENLDFIRPRVEYIGWVQRENLEQFEKVRKFQSMGFLPVSLNQIVEVISEQNNYKIVKIIEILEKSNEAKVEEIFYSNNLFAENSNNNNNKLQNNNIFTVSFDNIRPTNAVILTSWGQLNFQGGQFVDVFQAEKNCWIAGKTVQSDERNNIIKVQLQNSELIEINQLNNIRFGLEWIGGVEIQNENFEIENVEILPIKNFNSVNTDNHNEENKQAQNILQPSKKLTKQQKNQLLNFNMYEAGVVDRENLTDFEKAIKRNQFMFSKNQKIKNSWLTPKVKDQGRHYNPQYLLQVHGAEKMREYGYDVEKIQSKNFNIKEVIEPDLSKYFDARAYRHPENKDS